MNCYPCVQPHFQNTPKVYTRKLQFEDYRMWNRTKPCGVSHHRWNVTWNHLWRPPGLRPWRPQTSVCQDSRALKLKISGSCYGYFCGLTFWGKKKKNFQRQTMCENLATLSNLRKSREGVSLESLRLLLVTFWVPLYSDLLNCPWCWRNLISTEYHYCFA